MIPILGIMMGAYIVARCLEMIERAEDASMAAVVRIVSALALVVSVVGMYLVFTSSNTASETLRGLAP